MKKLILFIAISFFSFSMVCGQSNLSKSLIPSFSPVFTSKPVLKDLDNDGDPDLLYSTLFDSIPAIWIDDDDDMNASDWEGDLDNDCLIIDRNRDGIFAGPGDLSIDWIDNNADGIADMQVIVENSNPQITNFWDWQSNYMWIIDPEQDETFHFVDWKKLVQKCWEHNGASNFYEDYHGQTLFLKAHVPSYRFSNLEYSWENPFLFYDTDDDGLSEMSIRFLDECKFTKGEEIDTYPTKKISWAHFSFDLDNDNSPSNEFDFDMTIGFSGEGFSYENQVHTFNNMRGLPEADSLFYDSRWRQLDRLVYADHDSAWDLAFNCNKWSQCQLIFDEDDDCERWERVEFYDPKDPFIIGMNKGGIDNNPQADAAGDRGEWDFDNSGKGKLYIGFDNRIHLYGAELGYWRADFGAQSYQGWGGLYAEKYKRDQTEPQKFPTIKYEDTSNDGFFDRLSYDMDGDTIFETVYNLSDYDISIGSSPVLNTAQMSYDEVCSLFNQCTQQMWAQAEKVVEVAKKYNVNYKWYAFFLHPKSLNQKYDFGYWLQFYLFNDLLEYASHNKNKELEKELIQAYFSQNWGMLL